MGLSIYQPSSTTGFETQEDYQYFLHYRNQTVIDLSGAMPEEVWSQVIPRANVGHMALRNLTLAVSAMDKARHSSSPVPHSQFGVRIIILSYRTAGAALLTMFLAQYEQSLPGTMYCTRTSLQPPKVFSLTSYETFTD